MTGQTVMLGGYFSQTFYIYLLFIISGSRETGLVLFRIIIGWINNKKWLIYLKTGERHWLVQEKIIDGFIDFSSSLYYLQQQPTLSGYRDQQRRQRCGDYAIIAATEEKIDQRTEEQVRWIFQETEQDWVGQDQVRVLWKKPFQRLHFQAHPRHSSEQAVLFVWPQVLLQKQLYWSQRDL